MVKSKLSLERSSFSLKVLLKSTKKVALFSASIGFNAPKDLAASCN